MKRKRKYLNASLIVTLVVVWTGVVAQVSRQITYKAYLPDQKPSAHHNKSKIVISEVSIGSDFDPFAWTMMEPVKVMPQSVRRHSFVSSLRRGLQNPGSKKTAPKVDIPITYLGYIMSLGETTAVLKIGEKTELASSAYGLNFQIISLSDDSLLIIDDKGHKSHHSLNIIGSTIAKPGNGKKP